MSVCCSETISTMKCEITQCARTRRNTQKTHAQRNTHAHLRTLLAYSLGSAMI